MIWLEETLSKEGDKKEKRGEEKRKKRRGEKKEEAIYL